MQPDAWVDLIEASYDLAPDEAAWSRRVLESASPLFGDRLALVLLLVRISPSTFQVEHADVLGSEEVREQAIATNVDLPSPIVDLVYRGGATMGTLETDVFSRFPEMREGFLATSGGRVRDVRGVAGHTGTGWVAMFSAAQAAVAPSPTPLEGRRWARAATHVAAGLRLRRAVGALAAESPAVEAALDPGGRVHDARGPAASRSVRDLLRDAVRSVERARTASGRREPDAALEQWQGLVAGRWSLVDRFDSDGKRFVVAVRNDPVHTDPRGLTQRERQVAEFVGLGRSTKEVAYALGIASSTVGVCASSAARKLGLRSRAELAAFFSPAGVRARLAEMVIAGESLLVSAQLPLDLDALALLSDAERDVAALLVAGSTNADVARRRGTSTRTVANQVASILRKVGAGSRAELAARLQPALPPMK